MRILTDPNHAEPRKIRRAVEALERGGIVAYPTDTVYGLGCDATQKRAVDRLYQITGKPRDQLLAFMCPDLRTASHYAIIDDPTFRVLRRIFPGPYCVILKATREVPKTLLTKRKTVGIRVPNHPVAQALLAELGRPLLTTTASWKGEVLNDPEDIDRAFGSIDLILDAGWGSVVPSTIVDFSTGVPELVRQGSGPVELFT